MKYLCTAFSPRVHVVRLPTRRTPRVLIFRQPYRDGPLTQRPVTLDSPGLQLAARPRGRTTDCSRVRQPFTSLLWRFALLRMAASADATYHWGTAQARATMAMRTPATSRRRREETLLIEWRMFRSWTKVGFVQENVRRRTAFQGLAHPC